MNLIGLDVGGANIKVTDLNRDAKSILFPLWKQKEDLTGAIRDIVSQYRMPDRIALTMTGELADCFSSKEEGVQFITEAVVEGGAGAPVFVWQAGGEFVCPQVAIEFPLLTAAANWHALATWAARTTASTPGLLIDIGSTTADVIPLSQGLPAGIGQTDFERLAAGELVYTGGKRTPLCAVTRSVFVDEKEVPIAAEFFATTQDVYQILKQLPEEPNNNDTADGRPADVFHARQRVAKMVCCDAEELGENCINSIAKQLAEHQLTTLKNATLQVLKQFEQVPTQIVCSGSSEFLVRQLIDSLPVLENAEITSLTKTISPEIASAACAHAVTVLAYERC